MKKSVVQGPINVRETSFSMGGGKKMKPYSYHIYKNKLHMDYSLFVQPIFIEHLIYGSDYS